MPSKLNLAIKSPNFKNSPSCYFAYITELFSFDIYSSTYRVNFPFPFFPALYSEFLSSDRKNAHTSKSSKSSDDLSRESSGKKTRAQREREIEDSKQTAKTKKKWKKKTKKKLHSSLETIALVVFSVPPFIFIAITYLLRPTFRNFYLYTDSLSFSSACINFPWTQQRRPTAYKNNQKKGLDINIVREEGKKNEEFFVRPGYTTLL